MGQLTTPVSSGHMVPSRFRTWQLSKKQIRVALAHWRRLECFSLRIEPQSTKLRKWRKLAEVDFC
jgi:hypothetical protein